MAADPKDVALAQLREENQQLQKRLDDSVSKELALSILKGAAAELELAKTAVRKVEEEIGKSLSAVEAQIAKLGCPFPVWKTIQLGTCKFRAYLRNYVATSGNGSLVSGNASKVLCGIEISPKEESVELVKVDVEQLVGPMGRWTEEEIDKKAKEFGLARCPAEVGPQLRGQYVDQPSEELVLIWMEPIDGALFLLERRGDICWLDVEYRRPGDLDSPSYSLVFVRPLK